MLNSTDQPSAEPRDGTEDLKVSVGRVLAAVANHFTAHDPDSALDADSLLVCIGAEAYKLGGRSLSGPGGEWSQAALSTAPEVPAGITRGEYALLLVKAAKACGYDWSEDDNKRVIPTIPAPRPEPQPKGART